MTIKPAQKVPPIWPIQALLLAAGALEALLLARLVVRLLAGRPDNPAFALLLALTDPLVASLAMLNYDQPPYGAALEFSTLFLAILVPALAAAAYGWWRQSTAGRSGGRGA